MQIGPRRADLRGGRVLIRFRQPNGRHTQPIKGFHKHAAAFHVHVVADLRPAADSAEHVAADRRVGVFVDMQGELSVHVRHEREPVNRGGSVLSDGDAFRRRDRFARDVADDARQSDLEAVKTQYDDAVAVIVRKFDDRVEKLQRPLYTASISHRAKALLTNNDIPDEYMRHAPDMIAIGKALRAGRSLSCAVLSNPEPVLTIRKD